MSESKCKEKLFALGHPKNSGFWFRNENRMKVHNFKFRVQKLVRSTKQRTLISLYIHIINIGCTIAANVRLQSQEC